MEDIRARVQSIGDALAGVLADVYRGERTGGGAPVDENALLEVTRLAADVVRRAEGVLVHATEQIQERSETPVRDERLTTRLGCRSVNEVLQRTTRFGSHRVADIERVARGTRRPRALTGELLDPVFPAVRQALADGAVGACQAAAIIGPLTAAAPRAAFVGLLAADEELAAAARGDAAARRDNGAAGVVADAGPPATAAELRALAQVWAAYLDQDGTEPREEAALRKRGVVLGPARDGLVPIRGQLLIEVAAQLERLTHSILNPKNPRGVCFTPDNDAGSDAGDLPVPVDTRTRVQKQHDALATALIAAATSGGLPEIGGAAPTLVVTVREDQLTTGTGRHASIPGQDEPVPVSVAAHTGCVGTVQRVMQDRRGRIVSLGFTGRIFTARQRRAILTRDRGCVIPGCDTPPEWCEIHHVEEAARGGPTHTDNGVALCWHHHRTLATSGWEIRMRHGTPEIRGPAWWDRHRPWRPAHNRRWCPPV